VQNIRFRWSSHWVDANAASQSSETARGRCRSEGDDLGQRRMSALGQTLQRICRWTGPEVRFGPKADLIPYLFRGSFFPPL
jgi:hypothetical protein